MEFKTFKKRSVGLPLILPWQIGFMIFKLYPFASPLIYSFHDYNLFRTVSFTGLNNYKKILGDPLITRAFVQTFKCVFLIVPLELIFALFIARTLNFKIKGVDFFRTAYYIPSILGGSVPIAVLWRFLFKTEGPVNMTGPRFGIQPFNWLGDLTGVFWVIVLLRIRQSDSPMVVFLAALKGVSQDPYEAVSIDGAGKQKQFFGITIPLITPVIFYNLVAQLCNKFQEFNGSFTVIQGGSLRSITLVFLLVHNNAFKSYKMGMVSAIVRLLLLIIMTLTATSFLNQRYWVYYSDEDGR